MVKAEVLKLSAKYIGVILAGGIGERFSGSVPKQFIKIAGKPVIAYSTDVFQRSGVIDEIAIVVNSEYIPIIEKMVKVNAWSKVKKILPGGIERFHSSLAAIDAYTVESGVKLIFHDAARPLINSNTLDEIKTALEEYDAVGVAVPATDTVFISDSSGKLFSSVPDRRLVYHMQTPQAFKLEIIKQAYRIALQDPGFTATDDCGVIVKYLPDIPVYIIKGDRKNIKLTYTEDLKRIERLICLKSSGD
jgi:2-C-methyl-D-erythritol 4-phosphate cytidylyltransferase